MKETGLLIYLFLGNSRKGELIRPVDLGDTSIPGIHIVFKILHLPIKKLSF